MTILKIDSSITGENSVSRQLTRDILAQLQTEQPGAEIFERDVAAAVDERLVDLRADARVVEQRDGVRVERLGVERAGDA